ncbi:MAG: thiamine pyrophosphate-binding protein [Gammaproteobacteria bacterium]|nr:thiamine pyrophosphate-binding protein [Gammaproteobacteria bacterium]
MDAATQGRIHLELLSLIKPKLELGDLLILYLEQLGVEFVFGVPGGAIEPLYNALARSERRGGPRAIVSRHETGAAFMAHGYFSNSGKLAVCCSTTGPGATNLLTGVASAYENNVPMLVITAQTALSKFGRGALQESSDTAVNTVGMFQHCTGYNSLISHPDQFERKLVAALMQAIYTQTPSHISIPVDILRRPAEISKTSYQIGELLDKSSLTDETAVDRLYDLLVNSKKPLFVIGDACTEGVASVLQVAGILQALIITTPNGKGLVSPYHPMYRGVIGYAGHKDAMQTISDPAVDLIVAIGTSLSERINNGRDIHSYLTDRLVHIEEHEFRFARSPMAKMHIRGNIASVFGRLLEQMYRADNVKKVFSVGGSNKIYLENFRAAEKNLQRHFELDQPQECLSNAKPIKPQRLLTELPELFPSSTIYLADPGASMCWTVHYLHPKDRRISGERERRTNLFQSSMEFSSMGWSIGASVGVALARPDNPVVCIVGDGSWLMCGQEITVAKQHGLNIIYVILNDSALGLVKHGQKLANAEAIGYELPKVDFCKYAESIGIKGYLIEKPDDLKKLDINKILKARQPVILDVHIDPDEIPPMRARITALQEN